MQNSVIFYWLTLSLIRLASGLVHGNVRLDDSHSSLRETEGSFLSDLGTSSMSRVDPLPFAVESEEVQIMMKTGSYDEDVEEAVPLQGRAMRSPRRCIPHQQSCIGHQLPCCNPCDICYCRFFNAICYCRRVGQSCAHGRT